MVALFRMVFLFRMLSLFRLVSLFRMVSLYNFLVLHGGSVAHRASVPNMYILQYRTNSSAANGNQTKNINVVVIARNFTLVVFCIRC